MKVRKAVFPIAGLGTRFLPATKAIAKEIAFQDNLPKNKAGKIMRRLLKARELGITEGDTSTLDTVAE